MGWNDLDGSIARRMYCYVNTATEGKCAGMLIPDAMQDDAIRVCSMIDSYQNNRGERMSEDVFEKVAATKYNLDIIERTEEEARRGMLEGKAFMVIEIQVIGMVEKDHAKK